MRPLALAALAAALSLAGCGSSGTGICDCRQDQTCVRGRCFDTTPTTPSTDVPTNVPVCAAAPIQANAIAGTQALGVHPVGSVVSFDVPAGTASVTILLQSAGGAVAQIQARAGGTTGTLPNTAVPLTVRAPDGTVWFDDFATQPKDPSGALVFFPSAADAPVVGTLTFPNTSRGLQVAASPGLPAGTWTLVVSDYAFECTRPELAAFCGAQANLTPAPDLAAYAAGRYDVSVVAKPASPPAATLDVAFYLLACPGAQVDTAGRCTVTPLTAATAPADRDLTRMVATYRALLSKAGIAIGNVTWNDLPDVAQTRWARGLDLDATACDAQLGTLLAFSGAGRQMNLFLVPALIEQQAGGPPVETVGIDGTIPGPAGLGGTVQSGAVVSSADLRDGVTSCGAAFSVRCGADETAYIAAHETGHFLGLYHTTEAGGDSFDPIADTPTCPCASCGGSSCGATSAQVTIANCTQSPSCAGGDNLMFWVLGGASQGNVTGEQAAVMRSNPLVR